MLKIGDKVRVKKNLNEEGILKEYYDGPLDEEIKKEVLDFYSNTEAVHILEDALNGNFSTKEFGYVLVDRFLELVEED